MTGTGDHPLTGRTVLMVGATGGIGEGVPRSLLPQGATVVAIGRNASTLEQLADYARGTGRAYCSHGYWTRGLDTEAEHGMSTEWS